MSERSEREYTGPVWLSWSAQRPNFDLGLDVYHFVTSMTEWIHRRVEQVDFVDDRSVRRRVSVDFELPMNLSQTLIGGQPHCLVPLAILRKEPLVGFDLHDEAGGSIPLLTREQNSFASWSLMVAIGEAAARNGGHTLPLPLDVLADLRTLVTEVGDQPLKALRSFTKPGRRETKPLRRALMRDEVFRNYVEALAENFLLFVLVPHELSIRRVIKFSYVEPLPWPHLEFRPWNRRRLAWLLRTRLGLSGVPLDFEVPAINQAGSYHFEIEAPRGLVVESIELADDETGNVIAEDLHPQTSRVHIYAARPESVRHPKVWVWLQPAVSGLIRTSALFVVGVACLLVALASRAEDLRTGTAMTLLLAIPSFLAIFIVRPGEHLLASRVLLGIRSVVVALGTLPLIGAAGLVLGFSESFEIWMWRIVGLLGVGFAWIVAKSYAAAKAITS